MYLIHNIQSYYKKLYLSLISKANDTPNPAIIPPFKSYTNADFY